MSLEFNNEGEINAKQTNRNIILVMLLSFMSVSLAQNQLEFGLKSANPVVTEKGSESESGREVKLSHDKGPNRNLNMSPVGQSRQSIKMARKKQNKTNNNSEGIKRKKNKFLTL